MTYFYIIGSVWQIVLLVISQFAELTLSTGIILLFKSRSKLSKQIGVAAVFLLILPAIAAK